MLGCPEIPDNYAEGVVIKVKNIKFKLKSERFNEECAKPKENPKKKQKNNN